MTCTQTAAVDRTFGDEKLETQSRADWDAPEFGPDTQQLVTERERAKALIGRVNVAFSRRDSVENPESMTKPYLTSDMMIRPVLLDGSTIVRSTRQASRALA